MTQRLISPRPLVAIIAAVAAVLVPCPQGVSAIGPTLPVELVDLRDRFTVELRAQTDLIRITRVERQLYVDGERLRAEPVDVRLETRRSYRRGESRATLSLRIDGMERLAQRALAQKIVVEAQWLNQDSPKPLTIERWFYFLMRNGRIERVDSQTYSRAMDAAEATTDNAGRRATVSAGGDVRGEIPLQKTTGTAAVPVGPRGGAIEERPPAREGNQRPSTDRSEINER